MHREHPAAGEPCSERERERERERAARRQDYRRRTGQIQQCRDREQNRGLRCAATSGREGDSDASTRPRVQCSACDASRGRLPLLQEPQDYSMVEKIHPSIHRCADNRWHMVFLFLFKAGVLLPPYKKRKTDASLSPTVNTMFL
jgi:hypothetical protein